MSTTPERPAFAELQDVLLDDEFPALDMALRRGRHIDRDDLAWYQLLTDAQEHLEAFYRRYGCELIHKSDGYFYLLPIGERMPRRHLAVGDMLVGQALALLYLDPASIERGGVVTREQLVAQLVAVVGEAALIRTFHAKKRRIDERVAHKVVRNKVAEAVRRLAGLGFVDLPDDEHLRLRPSLLRFAEPVRGTGAPAEALARLAAEGEISMAEAADGDGDDDDVDDDGVDAADDSDDDESVAATNDRDDDAGHDDAGRGDAVSGDAEDASTTAAGDDESDEAANDGDDDADDEAGARE